MVEDDASGRLRSAISRLSRHLNSSAAVEGLAPSEASALALIGSRVPLSLAELTAIERLNPTMVSRIVGVLERRRLIQRASNPADQRVVVVEATPEGVQLKERIRTQRDRVVAEALTRLRPEERERLLAALPALEALAVELGERAAAQ